MKYKLFCTVTMKSYTVEALSELEARKKISKRIALPFNLY